MKTKWVLIVLSSLLFLITGCTSGESDSSNDINDIDSKIFESELEEEIYNGQSLTFGIIGEEPEIREDQVNFVSLGFEELQNDEYTNVDGIFVMEGYLSEAAEEDNRIAYENMTIPIFFVESKARVIPFLNITNQVTYEENVERINDNETYISGVWYPETEVITFEFKYPVEDSEYSRDSIEEVYSAVFKTVESEVKQ